MDIFTESVHFLCTIFWRVTCFWWHHHDCRLQQMQQYLKDWIPIADDSSLKPDESITVDTRSNSCSSSSSEMKTRPKLFSIGPVTSFRLKVPKKGAWIITSLSSPVSALYIDIIGRWSAWTFPKTKDDVVWMYALWPWTYCIRLLELVAMRSYSCCTRNAFL